MFSYIKSFFNYLFGKNDDEECDEEKERFVTEQLYALRIQAEKEREYIAPGTTPARELPRDAVCFQRTGLCLQTDTG